MIDRLKHMAIFARVVDEGSFRAAAKDLGLAPSRVSETVSDLEASLGVTLLYRTTRKIALTSEGRVFYGHVVDMLRSMEAGLDGLNAQGQELVGALRLSMPAFLAGGPLTKAIAEFGRLHPGVAFTVFYTDTRMQLIEDGLDLTIRVGWLDDSSMMSRKLGTGQRFLVAGTDYATARRVPKRPSDMEDWDWIRFRMRSDVTRMTSAKGQVEQVTGNAQIEVDAIEAVYHLCTLNAGVAVLPSFLAQRGIAEGKLVRLLPDWTLDHLGIYAVWPDTSRRQSLTHQFVQFLAEESVCK